MFMEVGLGVIIRLFVMAISCVSLPSMALAQGPTCRDLVEDRISVDGDFWSRLLVDFSPYSSDSLARADGGRIWAVGQGCHDAGLAQIIGLDAQGEITEREAFLTDFADQSAVSVEGRFSALDLSASDSAFVVQVLTHHNRESRATSTSRLLEINLQDFEIMSADPMPDGLHAKSLGSMANGTLWVAGSSRHGGEDRLQMDGAVATFAPSQRVFQSWRSGRRGDDEIGAAALAADEALWIGGRRWSGEPFPNPHQSFVGRITDPRRNRVQYIDIGEPGRGAGVTGMAWSEDSLWIVAEPQALEMPRLYRLTESHGIDREIIFPEAYPSASEGYAYNGRVRIHDLVATGDGGVLAIGAIANPDTGGDLDAWVIRANADGEILWSRQFGLAGPDILRSAIAMPDGSFVAVGATANGSVMNVDNGLIDFEGFHGWLVRIGANGEVPELN